MVKKKWLGLIFIIFLIVGVIHGFAVAISLNIFLTWIFIGLWVIIILKIFDNIKQHREFNSPHNTAFFVIIPLFCGIFYSIWGYFTGILGENLLAGTNIYFSLWSLIFGLPFVIYGSYSLYRCFKKYHVIYFGTKSVKAKVIGYFLTLFVIIFIIFYWIIFYSVIEFYNSPLEPLHFSLDLNLLILFIASLLIFIIFGIFFPRKSLPVLTNEYINNRTKRINSLATASNANNPKTRKKKQTITTRTQRSPTNRTVSQQSRSRSYSTKTTPTTRRVKQSTRVTRTTQTRRVKTQSKPPASSKSVMKVKNLNLYRPKTATISLEDFKCIFCFRLPKLPEDKNRGIILCPNCKYPAHADEFKDWLRTSNLCSRCSAPIPSRFRSNPKIISVKNYVVIYRYFLKNSKKR